MDQAGGVMTEQEAHAHLTETFDQNVRSFPEIMEPYVVLLADVFERDEQTSIMRRALRETIRARYPLKGAT